MVQATGLLGWSGQKMLVGYNGSLSLSSLRTVPSTSELSLTPIANVARSWEEQPTSVTQQYHAEEMSLDAATTPSSRQPKHSMPVLPATRGLTRAPSRDRLLSSGPARPLPAQMRVVSMRKNSLPFIKLASSDVPPRATMQMGTQVGCAATSTLGHGAHNTSHESFLPEGVESPVRKMSQIRCASKLQLAMPHGSNSCLNTSASASALFAATLPHAAANGAESSEAGTACQTARDSSARLSQQLLAERVHKGMGNDQVYAAMSEKLRTSSEPVGVPLGHGVHGTEPGVAGKCASVGCYCP